MTQVATEPIMVTSPVAATLNTVVVAVPLVVEAMTNRGVLAGLFNARYRPVYERLISGSRAAAQRALAIFVTPFARAMLRV